jgi:gamma-glutamyltranspeptidase/glutathione hydrolase/leukotriene-C4 hydrolase
MVTSVEQFTGLPDWAKLRGPQPGLRNPSYYVRGRHGAVAAENGVCSSIGIDVLRENGTATDAAIAAALCIGVVNPFSSGIGGGGFLVTRPACPPSSTKRTCPAALSIDFRETAPTGSFPAMFGDDPLASLFGGLAVGVPGELRGFEAAYKAHGGGVPWARLFEPSIALAEKHHVGPELARRLQMFASIMSTEPQWAKVFSPKGAVLLEGDVIRRPELAHTLRTLARHGADAFYRVRRRPRCLLHHADAEKGPIAEALAKVTQAHGGGMTAEDLAAYRAIVKPALVGTYRNRTIYTTHAPSSGAILISLLNTLEPLHDYVEEGRTPLNMHRFIEAQKYAFAHRTEFGDPAFVDNADKWREVVRKDFGRDTLALINDVREAAVLAEGD